eukprot:scaffold655_cov379-Prasinococcus_capsulatus_cf.AAC.10
MLTRWLMPPGAAARVTQGYWLPCRHELGLLLFGSALCRVGKLLWSCRSRLGFFSLTRALISAKRACIICSLDFNMLYRNVMCSLTTSSALEINSHDSNSTNLMDTPSRARSSIQYTRSGRAVRQASPGGPVPYTPCSE